MKVGIVAIKKAGYGMLEKHIEAIADVAEAENAIISFRNVLALAEDFIEAGCPTKSFCVKNGSVFRDSIPKSIPSVMQPS